MREKALRAALVPKPTQLLTQQQLRFRLDCFVILCIELHGYEQVEKYRIVTILSKKEMLKPFEPLLRDVSGFSGFFSLEPLFQSETSFRYKLHLDSGSRLRIETLLEELIQEHGSCTDGYRVVCTGLFLQIITFLCRSFSSNRSSAMIRNLDGKEAQRRSYPVHPGCMIRDYR